MNTPSRVRTVTLLGMAQTLAWASSYYLPAMLATPMSRDLGVATPTVFAAFSMASNSKGLKFSGVAGWQKPPMRCPQASAP